MWNMFAPQIGGITSALTGLVRLGVYASTKPVSPGFDGSEPEVDKIGLGRDGMNHGI